MSTRAKERPPKPKRSRALFLGLLAVVAVLAVWLGTSHSREGAGGAGDPQPEESWTGPYDLRFFRQSELGQALFAYLLCSDFDCPEALDKVRRWESGAAPPLLEALASGLPPGLAQEAPPKLIRRRAIMALGRLGDARAVEPLLEELDDADPLIRAAAAEALGRIGGETLVPGLAPLLEDADPLVRETTAAALGELGRPEASAALRRAAEREELEHVRRAIEAAIAAIERR